MKSDLQPALSRIRCTMCWGSWLPIAFNGSRIGQLLRPAQRIMTGRHAIQYHCCCCAAKKPEDQLFDSIDAQDLNKTLKDCMEGLSAKVRRSCTPCARCRARCTA